MQPARVRAQLNRILAGAAFVDAERARSFLRFIVERALLGRTVEIKESVIAVEVLGRKSAFDSKSDPIVRVEAGRLRARLRSYYRTEGSGDDVSISVPRCTGFLVSCLMGITSCIWHRVTAGANRRSGSARRSVSRSHEASRRRGAAVHQTRRGLRSRQDI
jgi:hypothetical protein